MKKVTLCIMLLVLCLMFTLITYAQIDIIGNNNIVNKVSIVSVGDIMCHNTQLKSAYKDGSYDFSDWFKPVEDHIKSGDLAICNLETVFAGEEYRYTSYPCFNTPSELGQVIKNTGFDVVLTANNHSLDRRNAGIVNTIDTLDKLGLYHTGTFKDKTVDDSVLFMDVKGIKIAIINYTYGTNGIPLPKENPTAVNIISIPEIIKDIEYARNNKADLIIAGLHFGHEYHRQYSPQQKKLVDSLFHSGVNIILGSHPHVIQGSEVKEIVNKYGEKQDCFVIYSQGNFISNQRDKYKDSGLITKLTFYKDKQEDRVRLLDTEYVYTWVDKSYIKNKWRFRVVPVIDSITSYENSTSTLISNQDYTRLKEVSEETRLIIQDK